MNLGAPPCSLCTRLPPTAQAALVASREGIIATLYTRNPRRTAPGLHLPHPGATEVTGQTGSHPLLSLVKRLEERDPVPFPAAQAFRIGR